ncbi:MAG: PQQ-like beta-propeller repeat protein [Planctomycetaceae bacterium]|nr:PQQ-like beta-propeller repeat protein [Planctomycetaceae bacterium]
MTRWRCLWGIPIIVMMVAADALPAGDLESQPAGNWHQWRGPLANGFAPGADPPLTWSEEQNIRWKISISGQGNSTPIVWQDRLFVLTTVDTGRVEGSLPQPQDQPERPFGIVFPNTFHRYEVICLDRQTGRELWRRTAVERVPHEGHHGDNSFASSSPTTDGERLYAWFGSAGCYCYDLSGELLWSKDLGQVETRRSFGEGASPVVHDGRLILVRDQEGPSSIVVLNARTGDELWRADRDEPTAWATPYVVEHDGRTQVITNATNRSRSYDLESGELLWECGGQVTNVIPSPVVFNDRALCMSGYRGSALFAIPLDARGDVTGTQTVTWSLERGTPYVPSPLLYDGRLYFNQTNEGIFSCVDAETGRQLMERTRLPGIRALYASPVGAAGRIYLVGRDGTSLVLQAGTELNVMATNRLDDRFDASPALVGNEIFLRGKQNLYCIGPQ